MKSIILDLFSSIAILTYFVGCCTVHYEKYNTQNYTFHVDGFKYLFENSPNGVLILTYEGMGGTTSSGDSLQNSVSDILQEAYPSSLVQEDLDGVRYLNVNGKYIEIRNSNWHRGYTEYSESLKRLDAQFGDISESHRTKLNSLIKEEGLHNRLIDVLLWVHDEGGVRERILATTSSEIANIYENNTSDDRPIIIVASSLGSDIFMTTLTSMAKSPGDTEKSALAAEAAGDVLSRIQVVYLWANQRALLNVIERSNFSESNSKELSEISPLVEFITNYESHGHTPPPIIAISDPNDILTYPLDEIDLRPNVIDIHYSISQNRYHIPFVGDFVGPFTAHTGHDQSDFVKDIFLNGLTYARDSN